jgi:hypothetical protein
LPKRNIEIRQSSEFDRLYQPARGYGFNDAVNVLTAK